MRLSRTAINGLQAIPGVKVHGITDPGQLNGRVPTVSFTMDGVSPKQISQRLAEENIFVWHGDYYAVEVIDFLGLKEKGGMLRVGAAHYNTIKEIDRLLEKITRLNDE